MKPPERNYRISQQKARLSKETRESENTEQTARKRLEKLKTGGKPLQRKKTFRISAPLETDWRISKETRDFENKGQTARKEIENFGRRSKPLEKD